MSIFEEKINSITLALKDGYEPEEALNKFLIGANGYFKQVESDLVTIRHKVTSIPDLENLEEGVKVKIDKIPFQLFLQIRMFFKEIYQEFKTESTICVMQNLSDCKYSLFVPEQRNSGANSNYKLGDSPRFLEELKTKRLVMVCHSHPWASTSVSPSGTDNNDEKEPILYMILSNVEKIPVYYLSTCDQNTRVQVPFFEVWENPIATIFTSAESNANDKEVVARLFAKLNIADILDACVTDVTIPYAEWKSYVTSATTIISGGYGSGYGSSYGSDYSSRSYYNNFYGDYYGGHLYQSSYPQTTTFGAQTARQPIFQEDKKKQEIKTQQEQTLIRPSIEEEYEFVFKMSTDEVRHDLEAGKYTFEQIHNMYSALQDDSRSPTILETSDDTDSYITDDADDLLNKLFTSYLPRNEENELIDLFLEDHLERDMCIDLDISDLSYSDKKAVCFHYFQQGVQDRYEFEDLSNIEKVLAILQFIDECETPIIRQILCTNHSVGHVYEIMSAFYTSTSLEEAAAKQIVDDFNLDQVYDNIQRYELSHPL